MKDNLFDILSARGFIAQTTDPQMRERLATPVVGYVGFDPTADSLGVGNLVPMMGLYWLQRCGHRPIAIVGGATALVGDPSGKSDMRKMLSREDIDRNAAAFGRQLGIVLRFDDSPSGAKLMNNADWLVGLNWIDLLREVGACFSVNRMLTMDSVKNRMDGGGISFLEFNYMVMQAYDFLHLYKNERCTLQLGGQDQWGNIVMGVDLTRRLADAHVGGLTFPLVTKADGSKFGKSEKGNVWLSADHTPVFDFFQFWRNTADADVRKMMGLFTTLPMDEVDRLTQVAGEELNPAKEVLAYEVTKLIHGSAAADKALAGAKSAFGTAHDVTGDSIPHGSLAESELEAGVGLLMLMVRGGLAQSNSEARRLVQGGGVRVQDRTVEDPNYTVGGSDVQSGYVLLRAGKKRLFRFDVS
jgi:tyrosyl-tRNA synthetase